MENLCVKVIFSSILASLQARRYSHQQLVINLKRKGNSETIRKFEGAGIGDIKKYKTKR
jgi:hypothetical protein